MAKKEREESARADSERPARGKPQEAAEDGQRRGFLEKFVAIVIGGIITLVPPAAGLFTFADPLRPRYKRKPKWVKVASLADVPADGIPMPFQVITDRRDAWSYYPPEAIATVYLTRNSTAEKPIALTSVCPHLGCSVVYLLQQQQFRCPCHQSVFEVDGKVKSGPPPRAMDALDVEIRGQDEVWVRYEQFKPGHSEKAPA